MGTTTTTSYVETDDLTRASQPHWQDVVEKQVKALRFGSVLITVHEGRVVQVETSTKVRFDKA